MVAHIDRSSSGGYHKSKHRAAAAAERMHPVSTAFAHDLGLGSGAEPMDDGRSLSRSSHASAASSRHSHNASMYLPGIML